MATACLWIFSDATSFSASAKLLPVCIYTLSNSHSFLRYVWGKYAPHTLVCPPSFWCVIFQPNCFCNFFYNFIFFGIFFCFCFTSSSIVNLLCSFLFFLLEIFWFIYSTSTGATQAKPSYQVWKFIRAFFRFTAASEKSLLNWICSFAEFFSYKKCVKAFLIVSVFCQ